MNSNVHPYYLKIQQQSSGQPIFAYCVVSPEPSLFIIMKNWSRPKSLATKIMHLAFQKYMNSKITEHKKVYNKMHLIVPCSYRIGGNRWLFSIYKQQETDCKLLPNAQIVANLQSISTANFFGLPLSTSVN